MAQHVVVVGGGSSGEHFVGALRRLDRESKVTVVERRLVGGECSYWACMPTKTMLRAPELAASAKRTLGSLQLGELDAQAIFAWRDIVAERDDSSQVEWLASQDAQLVRGDATFPERGLIQVGDTELRYDKLVLSTGSTVSTTGRTSTRPRRSRCRDASSCSVPGRSAASSRSSSSVSGRR